MNKKDKTIIVAWRDTGPIELHIEKVEKLWNNDWFISQWHDTYTLVKGKQNRERPCFKFAIYTEQANQLIKELGLVYEPSTIFNHAGMWRRPHQPL